MKRKLFILTILLIILIPAYVNAASVTTTLNCPQSAKQSSVVTCTILAKPVGGNLKGIQANIKITNGTYQSLTVGSGWTSYSNTASGFSFGRTTATTQQTTIGTLKVKMPASGSMTVSLSNVSGSDANYVTLSSNNVSKTIKVQSNVNTLSSLSITGATISPVFNSNTTSYSTTIDAPSITINATATDSKSKISGIGKKNLNYGTNTFNIVVTSESGVTKTYTIKVTRPDGRSNNNNLKSLSVNQGTISFNKNTTSYNLSVESNITSIQLNAAVEDSKASFVNGYGPRIVKLNYGDNKIEIKVKAENNSIKTYTINVNRKDNRSTNNYLKELTISSGKITFNKYTTDYTTAVYYDVTKLNVTAVAEDSKATVTINNPDLKVGNNIITIVVKAENTTTRTYKIMVTRHDQNVKMSDNNNIASLKILGHDIEFKKDILEYDLTIKDEYALVFEISLEDPNSSYKIEGNEKLENGSVIKVITTSESGQNKEYKFNVKKEIKEEVKKEESNNQNGIIYGIIGFGVGCIITFIVTSLVKGKKKDNNTMTNQIQN